MLAGQPLGFTDPFAELAGLGRRATATRRSPVPRRRDDRREVGHLAARTWRRSPREPPARARARSHEGRFEREIVPLGDVDASTRARAATPRWRRWPTLKPLVEGGRHHRGGRRARSPTAPPRCWSPPSAALEAPRPDAAGAHPPPQRARRRPGLDADRADPGHRARAGEGRHDDRRHRPGRDQRGVRLGRAGLAEGDRRRPERRSTSTAARSRSATRSAPPAPG